MRERDLFLELANAMREEAKDDRVARRQKQASVAGLQTLLTEQWAARYRLKPARGRLDWKRLVGRRSGDIMEPLPGDDHCSLWIRDGTAVVYVSQPYVLPAQTIALMQEAGLDNGLAFDVDTWPAWHFPGAVLFVTWFRAGSKWYEADD